MKNFLAIFASFFIFVAFVFSPSPVRAAGVVSPPCNQVALQSALAGGGNVTFNCGTATITLISPLTITQNTTIDGGGQITLSGGGTTRMIEHTAGTLTLQNITLTNGRAQGVNTDANGSAIRSRYQGTAPRLNLDNVTISSNTTNLTSVSGGLSPGDFGGAVFTQGGYLTVTDSTFSSNTSTNSAGAAIHGLRSDMVITDTTFSNNVSNGGGQGGAIYVDGAQPNNGIVRITGGTFSGNTAFNQGGALYVHLYQNNDTVMIDGVSFLNNQVNGGTNGLGGAFSGGNGRVTVLNSLFSGNKVDRPGDADGSGGAFASAETAVITIANSTFTGNRAEGVSYNANGGAIYIVNNSQQFQIINSTIASNFAGWVGGGISSSPISPSIPGGRLTNTIVANNTAENGPNDWQILQQCSEKLANGGGNIQYPPKNPNPNFFNETICAENITIANPLLGALANNGGPTQTIAIPANSPAIDAGNQSRCTPSPVSDLDQRGYFRTFDGNGDGNFACDIGAFEFSSFNIPSAPDLQPHINAYNTATPTLRWQSMIWATGYEIQIDNTAGFNAPLAFTGTTVNALLNVPALTNGVYYWRVRGQQSSGVWGDWSGTETFAVNLP